MKGQSKAKTVEGPLDLDRRGLPLRWPDIDLQRCAASQAEALGLVKTTSSPTQRIKLAVASGTAQTGSRRWISARSVPVSYTHLIQDEVEAAGVLRHFVGIAGEDDLIGACLLYTSRCV